MLKKFLILLTLFPSLTYAESIQLVHWWNAYFPAKEQKANYNYRGIKPNSIQYQDVNQDGIRNDALLWYEFSLTTPLNPLPPDSVDSKSWQRYRINRSSAQFYGGMVFRFTNVSHLTTTNRQGEQEPIFDHIQQSTVQPTEGANPCSYSTRYPSNVGRSWGGDLGDHWSDMTIMVINEGGECCPISDKFQKTKDAQVNFTTVFLWKKENFLNGGNQVETITFDDTSKLSVDVTRERKNVEEVRFVVQDGEQLWISEATSTVVWNETIADEIWIGKGNGIQVQDLGKGKMGVMVEFKPVNSGWAIYNPQADSEEISTLANALQKAAFNPKKASDAEKQRFYEQSDQFGEKVNRMQFNPKNATFVEHTFTDVQAVGVYFATYELAHKVTQLVFDNFQAFAVGQVPPTAAIAIDLQQNQIVANAGQFSGSLAINCGKLVQTVTQCASDHVTVHGMMRIDPIQVGKIADIVVVAAHKLSPEDEAETFYTLGQQGQDIQIWNGQVENLLAFQTNIPLTAEQSVAIYQGQLPVLGLLRFFFGYRLPGEQLVFSPQSLDSLIIRDNTDAQLNELPYSESIKSLCTIETG